MSCCIKKPNHSRISGFDQPRRVFTLTGKSPAPSLAAAIISAANSGVLMRAEQPPFLIMSRTGQPILISIPANPRCASSVAISRKYSGVVPQICATNGPSSSCKCKRCSIACLPAEQKPSTLANSVKYTSAGANSCTSLRNTTSVTSSIGAKATNGLSESFSQIFSCVFITKI